MPERNDWYDSKRWKKKRAHILLRDNWLDQIVLRDGVRIPAQVVHHILPREEYPQYAWEDWNLISVSQETHKKRLHEKYTGKLTRIGKALMYQTAAENGIQLKMLTMVIGLPGTGKSTWVKKHLEGGLVYELDSIACAFRLTIPHKEPVHAGARRMAAALRRGWIEAAKEYSNNLFVVRTAPDTEELIETKPDRIVVCTRQFVDRPYRYDRDEYISQIRAAIKWAEENGVEILCYPPGSETL